MVPTLPGKKERGFCDFPFFTKKKKKKEGGGGLNVILQLCECKPGPGGLGRTIRPDTEHRKPKGGRNLDNGAEVSGGVDGGADMIARKEFQCE